MKRLVFIALVCLGPCPVESGHPEVIQINMMRSQRGLYSYRYNMSLDAVASNRSRRMAAANRGGHLPGSFSPGTAEGVSWGSGAQKPEIACYTKGERFRKVGASCSWSGNRWYCAVVYGGGDGTGWIGQTPYDGRSSARRFRLFGFFRR